MSRGTRGHAAFDAGAVAALLHGGLERMRIELAPANVNALIEYLRLLHQWNAAYRLSGIRDPLEMVATHVLDSLSVLGVLEGRRCLDVGTGAGLPGLVLAIGEHGASSPRRWTLLDSNLKKVTFCRQAAIELGLDHVQVAHSRVETHAPPQPYDTVTTRATFAPADSAARMRPQVASNGLLVCMCGEHPGSVRASGFAAHDVVRVDVPGAARRHLLRLRAA